MARARRATDSVNSMSRPVPPQVIPRPPAWRPGRARARGRTSPCRADRHGHGPGAGRARGARPARTGAPRTSAPTAWSGPAVVVNESRRAGLCGSVNAAVLAVLFEEAGEARVILTRRSSRLRTHSGEVSFPGGRMNEGEGPGPAAVARGVRGDRTRPCLGHDGRLDQPGHDTGLRSLIMPVLATVPRAADAGGQPARGRARLRRPLAELADPSVFHEERWRMPGRTIAGTTTTPSRSGSSRCRAR